MFQIGDEVEVWLSKIDGFRPETHGTWDGKLGIVRRVFRDYCIVDVPGVIDNATLKFRHLKLACQLPDTPEFDEWDQSEDEWEANEAGCLMPEEE